MEEAAERGQDKGTAVNSVHGGQSHLQEEVIAIDSFSTDLSPGPRTSEAPSPSRDHAEAIPRATSASVWAPSSPESPSISMDVPDSDALTCPYTVEPATARSDNTEDARDYIEEEDLYRSLAENESAVVPFGTSLERYLAGVIYRYGKGEWSIEDARQVCAYVTGPHRLAPLLWRTARMAPRPPRGYATSSGQAISVSRITTDSFQGARPPNHHSDVGVPGSQFGRFWEAPSSDTCARTGNNYGDEMSDMSGTQRRTRDYELYHQGSLRDREDRRTSDGPFPMSGAHSSPHRLGRQGLHTMHQMGALPTGVRSPRSENADTGSPAASNDALVFWDEQSLQQMYLRRHDGTEYGSLSDYGGTREYNTTPEYPERQEDDSVRHFVHNRRDAEEVGNGESRGSESSLGGVLHSIPLPDGMGVVRRGESPGNLLGFGLDPSHDSLPPRDSFQAASQYSEEDPARYLSSNPRSTLDEGLPGRASADENNPFLAHLLQAADSRVSTSSMQGVRIAPIDPDSLNAASSYPSHAFAHGSTHDQQHDTRSTAQAHATQYVSTGAQYGSPGTPIRFRDGPRRQRRGTGDGYVTAEDVAYSSAAPESGRTCDIFRGQHGEPTLSRYPPVMFPPLRRAHSTPEMQLEPLISDSSGLTSGEYWRESEDSQVPRHQRNRAIDGTPLTSRDGSNGGRRVSSADIADGSDQLTHYYATILDKMQDPRTHSLMQRTLDIFNNQPPSTASTAETSEIALAGTRAAAMATYERNSTHSTCSRNGASRSTQSVPARRCLFARGPQGFEAHSHPPQDLPPKHSTGGRSSRGSAAAAAAAMVADSRCLFARPGAGCTPGAAPSSGCVPDWFASAASPPSPQLASPGPYRAASISRTSFSSSNVCLEVVPETAEVYCDAVGTSTHAFSSSACPEDSTCEASRKIPDVAVPGGPFLDLKGHAAVIGQAAHLDLLAAGAFCGSDAHHDTLGRRTGDSWFSQCCSLDSQGDAEDGAMSETMNTQSPTASQDGSPGQREASLVGGEPGTGCPSNSSSTCGAFQMSASRSGSEQQLRTTPLASSTCASESAGHQPDARYSVTISSVPGSLSPRPAAPPNTAVSPQASSADCSSSAAPRSPSCGASLQNVDQHYSDTHRLRHPRKLRRHPHPSTTSKPPLIKLSKTGQVQKYGSMAPVHDTRGPGRTTSAEDMALLRLEPRRRHCSLRISSDRAPCEADASQDARSRSGSSASPASRVQEIFQELADKDSSAACPGIEVGTAASVQSFPIMSQELPEGTICLDARSSNDTYSRSGHGDAILRAAPDQWARMDQETHLDSPVVSANSCNTEHQRGQQANAVVRSVQNGRDNQLVAPAASATANAASSHISSTGRRNSTLSTTAHNSSNRSIISNSGIQPAGLLNHSFTRRSFAASSSSVGRFNGLIYTSATGADGQITTNRNPGMSLPAPVTVTVRSSASKVSGFGNGGGGEHNQGRVLRSTAEKPISISFRKTMR